MEPLEKLVDEAVKQIVSHIFEKAPNDSVKMCMVFQFTTQPVYLGAKKICSSLGMHFNGLVDPDRPLATQIIIDDAIHTKFRIAMGCAKLRHNYLSQGREIDFTCHGIEWKPDPELPKEEWTLLHKIYSATYGAQ